VERLETSGLEISEERVAWEGLASSCDSPLRRLVAFLLVGFTAFITLTTAVVLFYNLFGDRAIYGQGVQVPQEAFYGTMIFSLALALGAFGVWLLRSLRSHAAFSRILRQAGLDPHHPTVSGLRAYSDEQLLALRSRYEKLNGEKPRELFARTFGFHEDDSFSLGPLSVRPETFEMGSLRVEWETNLILRSGEDLPTIRWWTESRRNILPRRLDGTKKLVYASRYTNDSVRELKRRYGYRTERWHVTVPEGKLWDAVRDFEEHRRIQAALGRKSRVG
jgi:hypothetical protein